MRTFLLVMVLISSGASAQTAAPSALPVMSAAAVKALPKSDWMRVEMLKPGTTVRIKTLTGGKTRCSVAAVSADAMTCGGVVFQRSAVEWIKGAHKTRSTLVGIAIGFGASAAVTAAVSASCKSGGLDCLGSIGVVAVVDVGLLVAIPIVFGIYDLTAGTIYKANTVQP